MLSTPLSRRVTMDSLTTRPHLHTTCLIVYVWTPRSWPGGPPSTHPWRIRWWLQWLRNFLPRMSARNFSERSWPSSKRLKFLRCLRVLQRHPTCSCYVVMPSSGTSISSPKFSLQCGQLRLKVIMWLVLNQRSFKLLSGPSDKLIVWQAHQWLSPSRKKSRPTRRRHPRRQLLGLPCLTGWAPLHPQRRGLSHRSRPFELAPEGPVHDPSKEARSLASLLLLPQPSNVDGPQVGARLADFAPHWRSLLGNCRAAGIVEDGVGIAFQQRPQLTHQSISFRTRNSRQDLQQAVDALLMKGAIERVTNVKSLGFYSRLFLVPKKTGDLRPVIDLSTLNRHMVVPHFKMETQGSVRSAIRSQEWTVSIDIQRCLSSCADASSCLQVSAFRGQQEGVPVHLSSVWTGDFSTGVHRAAETRRLAVEAARCEATRLLRRLADQGRYTWRSSTARPDNHQGPPVSRLHDQLREVRPHTKSRLPVHRDAVQHSTFHSGAPAENACKGPVSSSTLDGQSEHTARDLHRLLGMLVFMAWLVRRGRLHLLPVQW